MVENLTLGLYTDTVSRALELRPDIRWFLQSRSRNPDDAEDLVQETYLKLLEGQETFDPEKGSLKRWLFRIAHNAYVDHVRSNIRRQTVELDECDAVYDFTDQVDAGVDAEAILSNVLPILNESQAEIVNLAAEGFTNVQIAEKLSKSLATVKTQRHRVKVKVKKLPVTI